MTSQVRPAPRLRWLPRPRLTSMQREAMEGFLFISPWVIGFLVFTAGPLVASLYLSFTDWGLVGSPKLVGFKNYAAMANDRLFWQALSVTIRYTLFSVPLGLILALVIALLMIRPLRGIYVMRTIYYLPSVIGGVAVSLLWLWVFNPEFGILNYLLGLIGIKGPGWLADSDWALPALILMSLWSVGGSMIIFVAGLQSIPAHLYEAAELDGANAWHRLWAVTIPMLSPTIFFNLVMAIIGSFQTFTAAFVMTSGGPLNSTLFYVLYLYQNAFKFFKMGYASALAWILFIIILLCTLLVFRSSPMWVFYESEVRR
jgi:multiple sugar transport system permease protein